MRRRRQHIQLSVLSDCQECPGGLPGTLLGCRRDRRPGETPVWSSSPVSTPRSRWMPGHHSTRCLLPCLCWCHQSTLQVSVENEVSSAVLLCLLFVTVIPTFLLVCDTFTFIFVWDLNLLIIIIAQFVILLHNLLY